MHTIYIFSQMSEHFCSKSRVYDDEQYALYHHSPLFVSLPFLPLVFMFKCKHNMFNPISSMYVIKMCCRSAVAYIVQERQL